jgi:hypothetical protein
MKKLHFGILFCIVVVSCGLFESNGNGSVLDKVYVALQGLDQVGIVETGTGEMTAININIENMGIGGMNMIDHTPHFIVIDVMNGYWFVTSITIK